MKEKLLYLWQDKFDTIYGEYNENKRKLESLYKRRRRLWTDILWQLFYSLASFVGISLLEPFREVIYFWFVPFFVASIFGLKVAAIWFNGRGFVREFRRLFHHTRRLCPIEYPKPKIVPTSHEEYIPANYYVEEKCLEWLQKQYARELIRLNQLKRKMNEASEQECGSLIEELEHIILYASVKCAKH